MGQRIMVQVIDHAGEEDKEAVYLACELARKSQGEIVFVAMIQAQHASWLGTEFGQMALSASQQQMLDDARMTAEDYGVPSQVVTFQYYSLPGAISDAAKNFEADIVFAHLSNSLIPAWDNYQRHQLRLRLTRQGRVLADCPTQPKVTQSEPVTRNHSRRATITNTAVHLGAQLQEVMARR